MFAAYEICQFISLFVIRGRVPYSATASAFTCTYVRGGNDYYFAEPLAVADIAPLLVFAVISIITECSKQINCITDSQWRTVPSVLINVLRCQNIILFTADECFVILTQTHRVCGWCIVIVMVIDFSAAL